MRGLFVKDMCLLKQQIKIFLLMILIGIALAVSMHNPIGGMGYLIIATPIYAVGTISYDEFDHGNAFLFTLPFARHEYVIEKYLLGIGLSGITAVVGGLVAVAIGGGEAVRESIASALVLWMFAILILSLDIPLALRYGAEKARMARAIVFAAVFFVCFSSGKLLGALGVDAEEFADRMLTSGAGLLAAGCIAVSLVILLISILCSMRVLRTKNF